MTEEMLRQTALREVAVRRQKALMRIDDLEQGMYEALPALKTLAQQQTQAGIQAGLLSMSGAQQAEIDAQLAQTQTLQAQYEALLQEHGYHADYKLRQYTCKLCQDTARTKDGKLCTCVQEIISELRQKQVNSASPLSLCSFDAFDITLYPDTMLPEIGTTIRQHMQDIYAYCYEYAHSFSLANPSLYLCGYAGLGKTHLALSIAKTVLQAGFHVVYISAQNAFSDIEKERFDPAGNTMETLEGAQLLILDDLGTEFLTPYLSSNLYRLMNTRINRGLPTIYTSNIIDDKDLQRRYTEKIVSRLLGSCETLSFFGNDIRLS